MWSRIIYTSNRGFLSNAMRLFTISSCLGMQEKPPPAEGDGDEVPEVTEVGPKAPTISKSHPFPWFCWHGCCCCCCCCCWKKSESIKNNVCQSGKDEFMNAYLTCFSSQYMCQAFFLAMTRIKMTSHHNTYRYSTSPHNNDGSFKGSAVSKSPKRP